MNSQKEIRSTGTRVKELREGELDEGRQKVQTSGYQISTQDVMYDITSIINITVHYIRKLLSE